MLNEYGWNIRVYYEDTDAGGIVFYANYLKFFERARTEWLRACGVDQQGLAAQYGVIFVVKNVAVDYHAPAQLDDELNVTVVVRRLGRASLEFRQEAWRMGSDGARSLLATGDVKVGCIDAESLRPSPIPDHVTEKIKAKQGTA